MSGNNTNASPTFGIEFTNEKHYDLDLIEESNKRDGAGSIVMKTVDTNSDLDVKYEDGELITSKEQERLSITHDDVKRYLFNKKR